MCVCVCVCPGVNHRMINKQEKNGKMKAGRTIHTKKDVPFKNIFLQVKSLRTYCIYCLPITVPANSKTQPSCQLQNYPVKILI